MNFDLIVINVILFYLKNKNIINIILINNLFDADL